MKLYGRGRNGLSASLGAPANAGPARLELPRFSELVRQLASEKVAPLTVLTVALAVGALIRLTFVLIGDGFPLNDGGMFLVMVEDLKPGFGLPQYTSYNGGDIPYAYSPLMFYLTPACPKSAAGARWTCCEFCHCCSAYSPSPLSIFWPKRCCRPGSWRHSRP